jgi:RNA polymerase sigma factor (sigma-70 family)
MIEHGEEIKFTSDVLERNLKEDFVIGFAGKSDKEVWREFKSGSEVALTYIYNQYFQTLYRYGSQFTRDRGFIKDAIQDLFIELLKRRGKLSDTTSIKYYLFKSLKTNIISKLRRRKILFIEETNGYDFDISVSIEEKIINTQLDEERKQRLTNAIKKLKKKQQEIIYYYYFEDLDFFQIASLMQFSNQKSVQNLLYRALHLLKNSLLVVWHILILNFFIIRV